VSAELISKLAALQEEWERLNPAAGYKDYGLHSRYAELDAAFHLSIVDALGNPKLSGIISGLNIQRRVAPLVFASEYRGPVRRVAEHREILEALARRDAEATRLAVLVHIENARRELIAFLERKAVDAPNKPQSEVGAPAPSGTGGKQ